MGSSRLAALGAACIVGVLLALGALPGPAEDVRSVEAQEAATPTPTFVWQIPNTPNGRCSGVASQNRDCLHVDPPTGQFQYFSSNPAHTPVAATVRNMGVTQQRVWWSWYDTNRTVFVWGNVDRVRKSVKMTMLQRTSTATTRSTLSREGTPWSLPKATEPAVVIQDFRFVPRRKIIESTQQIQFQNSSRLRHEIVFTRATGSEPTTGVEYSPIIGVINPGRIAAQYPLRPANRPTPLPEATPAPLWSPGTYTYVCLLHTFMTGVVVVPDR